MISTRSIRVVPPWEINELNHVYRNKNFEGWDTFGNVVWEDLEKL